MEQIKRMDKRSAPELIPEDVAIQMPDCMFERWRTKRRPNSSSSFLQKKCTLRPKYWRGPGSAVYCARHAIRIWGKGLNNYGGHINEDVHRHAEA